MGLLDILNQYAQQNDRPPPEVFDDFDRISQEVSEDDLSHGLEQAFQSDATPPFEQMVGQLYDNSDEDTRAGLLNEILGSLGHGGGGALASGLGGGLAGGVLGGVLRRMGDRQPRISPNEVRQIPSRDIEVAAAEAARQNPGIVQNISRFYARHPQLVHTLGQAALGILMSGMARRRRGL